MGSAYPYLNVSCTLCSVAGVFKVTEFGAVDNGSEPAGVISVCDHKEGILCDCHSSYAFTYQLLHALLHVQ